MRVLKVPVLVVATGWAVACSPSEDSAVDVSTSSTGDDVSAGSGSAERGTSDDGVAGTGSTGGNSEEEGDDDGGSETGEPVVDPWPTPASFVTALGGGGTERASGLARVPDGFLVGSNSGSFSSGDNTHALLAKLDLQGNMLWTRVLSEAPTTWEYGGDIVGFDDGSGLMLTMSGEGGVRSQVVRFDAAGEIVWQREYGGLGDYAPLTAAAQGETLTALVGGIEDASSRSGWVLLLDASGEPVWSKEIAVPGDLNLRDIAVTHDGGYTVVGQTRAQGADWDDIFVAKLDAAGAVLWHETFGLEEQEGATGVVATADGLIVTGYTWSAGAGLADILLLRFSHDGELTGSYAVGDYGMDIGQGIGATAEGEIVLLGETSISESPNVVMLRLDRELEITNTSVLGTDAWDYLSAVDVRPGGHAAFVADNDASGHFDLMVGSVDPELETGSQCSLTGSANMTRTAVDLNVSMTELTVREASPTISPRTWTSMPVDLTAVSDCSESASP